jgi:hypothetical protein
MKPLWSLFVLTVIMAVNPAVSINLIDDVVMLTDSDDVLP